jgi:hypothetical protein
LGTKQEEAALLLQLYEIRCEEEFRKARQWFDTEFAPQSAEEVIAVVRGSFASSAHFRKVLSYWDMVAALVNHGAIDAALLHATNVEHLRYYAKLEPFIAGVREVAGADSLFELEKLVRSAPDFEQRLKGWRELNQSWAEQPESQSASA